MSPYVPTARRRRTRQNGSTNVADPGGVAGHRPSGVTRLPARGGAFRVRPTDCGCTGAGLGRPAPFPVCGIPPSRSRAAVPRSGPGHATRDDPPDDSGAGDRLLIATHRARMRCTPVGSGAPAAVEPAAHPTDPHRIRPTDTGPDDATASGTVRTRRRRHSPEGRTPLAARRTAAAQAPTGTGLSSSSQRSTSSASSSSPRAAAVGSIEMPTTVTAFVEPFGAVRMMIRSECTPAMAAAT